MKNDNIIDNPDAHYGCVDAETEVLTPYGFWRFNRIQKIIKYMSGKKESLK